MPSSRTRSVALLLGLIAVAYRLVLLGVDVPPTNSDEATMGLAALHIASGTEHPVWFPGQAYMGTLEAYLAAPLVGLFGAHTFLLRIPVLLLYVVFLFVMYRLTRALFPPGLVLVTLALLALGADRVVKNELITAGGYPEILPAAAALVLLSWWLARTRGRPSARPVVRLAGFGAWGLIAGLCLWVDWLALPYLVVAGLLLVAGCRRELWGRPGAVLAAALLVGAAPLLAYNLTAPPGRDSLTVNAHLSAAGSAGLGAHLHGAVLVGLPMATGLCAPSHCAGPVLAWGPAYLVLLAVAAVLALRGLRRTTGPVRLRHLTRLALLAGAVLTIVAYTRSGSSVQDPVESARYLHCLLVSLPVVLWPLWRLRLAGRVGLAALLAAAVVASGALVAHIPEYRRFAARQDELITALDRVGARRVYSDYWTCDRIMFATRERIACAVLADDLAAGLNRYPEDAATVAVAARPAYVFPAGSPADLTHARRLAAPMTRVDAAGYHIYLPGPTPNP